MCVVSMATKAIPSLDIHHVKMTGFNKNIPKLHLLLIMKM